MESLEPYLFNRILFETISISFDNLYSTQIISFRLVSHQWVYLVDNNILLRNLTQEMNKIDITILFYDSILLKDWMLISALINEYNEEIDWMLNEEEYARMSCIETDVKLLNKRLDQIQSIFGAKESAYNAFCTLSVVHRQMPYSLFIKCVNIISRHNIITTDEITRAVYYDDQNEDIILYRYICYLSFNFLPIIPINFDLLSVKILCSINIRNEHRKDAAIYLRSEYDFLKEIQNNGAMIDLLDDKYMNNSGEIDETIYELILCTLAKWQ